MRAVTCLGLSKRMPASPTAAQAMATPPRTSTSRRLASWRLPNFTSSPSRRRHHEGAQAAVGAGPVAAVPVGRAGAEVDVPGPGGVVDGGELRRAGDLDLALLLASARPLGRVGVAAAGVHARGLGVAGL